jgi:hypothetical protein
MRGCFPSGAQAPAPPGYPFGSRQVPYAFGALPALVTVDAAARAAADASCLAHFQKLVDHHLLTKAEAPGLPVGGMMPRFSGNIAAAWSTSTGFERGAVSEGFGYYLMLAPVFEGANMGVYPALIPDTATPHPKAGQPRPTPKQIFDGMLTTVMEFPATQYALDNPGDPRNPLTAHLMEWSLNGSTAQFQTNGTTPTVHGGVIGASNGDKYPAPDGDLDIAMGLLMGERQWPGNGYGALAVQRIAALKAWNFRADGTVKSMNKPAGWGGYPDPAFTLVRTSDFMFNHFRAFARATNDPFWLGETEGVQGTNSAYTRALRLTQDIQARFSPTTGLLPDFIERTETPADQALQPILPQHKLHHSDPGFVQRTVDNAPVGHSINDVYVNHAQKFNSNAVRFMWRVACDYVFSGDPELKAVLVKVMDFFESRITANAGAVSLAFKSAYDLDGTPRHPTDVNLQPGNGDLVELLGSILAGLCADPKYAASLDKMWRWCRGNDGGRMDPGYYSGPLELLGRLLAAGLWWEPAPGAAIPAATIPPPPPAGESAIIAAVASATSSHWGDFGSLSRFNRAATGGVVPSAYDGVFGRLLDRGTPGSGRDFIETTAAERPLLQLDANGKPNGRVYAPGIISGVGATTGDFYYVLMVDNNNFASTILSSMAAANQGIRYRYDGSTGKHFLDRGIVGATKTAEITGTAGVGPGGKYLIALRCVGGVLGIRKNKGVRGTMALGAAAAAGAPDLTVNANVDLTSVGVFNGYGWLFVDGHCPSDAAQDLIETEIASKGDLTI